MLSVNLVLLLLLRWVCELVPLYLAGLAQLQTGFAYATATTTNSSSNNNYGSNNKTKIFFKVQHGKMWLLPSLIVVVVLSCCCCCFSALLLFSLCVRFLSVLYSSGVAVAASHCIILEPRESWQDFCAATRIDGTRHSRRGELKFFPLLWTYLAGKIFATLNEQLTEWLRQVRRGLPGSRHWGEGRWVLTLFEMGLSMADSTL